MFYLATVKLHKQITSLKGKFRNPLIEEEIHLIMINQTSQRLDFVLATPMYAGFVEDPKKLVRHWLDECLFSVFTEHLAPEDLSVREIDKQLFLDKVSLDNEYMADSDDLISMFGKFDFDLQERSSVYELDSERMNSHYGTLKETVAQIPLKTNIFLINPKEEYDEPLILSLLIKRLVKAHQALSSFYFELDCFQHEYPLILNHLDDRSFLNTVLGKSVVVRMDYKAYFELFSHDLTEEFIKPLVQLSKLVPVIIIPMTHLSNHLIETLSDQFKAAFIKE